MQLQGFVNVSILASTNDWDPTVTTADWIRVTSSGTWDVTGLTAKYRGRLLTVSVLSGTIVIRNASGSSAVGNRFVAAGDITVTAGQTIIIAYDLTSTAWRVLTQPSTGVGGPVAADDVSYDNTASGLTATDMQAAIDEIAASGGGGGGDCTCVGELLVADGVSPPELVTDDAETDFLYED